MRRGRPRPRAFAFCWTNGRRRRQETAMGLFAIILSALLSLAPGLAPGPMAGRARVETGGVTVALAEPASGRDEDLPAIAGSSDPTVRWW